MANQNTKIKEQVDILDELLDAGVTLRLTAKTGEDGESILNLTGRSKAGVDVPQQVVTFLLVTALAELEDVAFPDLLEGLFKAKEKAKDRACGGDIGAFLEKVIPDLVEKAKQEGVLDEDTDVEAKVIKLPATGKKGKKDDVAITSPVAPELPPALQQLLDSLNGNMRG